MTPFINTLILVTSFFCIFVCRLVFLRIDSSLSRQSLANISDEGANEAHLMCIQKVVTNVKNYGKSKTVSLSFILSHKRMIITDDVMSHHCGKLPIIREPRTE